MAGRALVRILGAAVLASVGAASAAEGGLEVRSLDVRFGPALPGRQTFAVSSIGRLRLSADFPPDAPGTPFDPGTNRLRVTVGDVRVFDGPDYAGTPSVRYGRDGEIRVRERRPFDERGSLDLRIDLARGRISLDARGLDVGRLLGHGSDALPVAVEIRDEVHATIVDMTAGDRRWTYGSRGLDRRSSPRPREEPPEGFARLGGGDWSGIDEPFALVIRDGEALAAFWDRLAAVWLDRDGNHPALPAEWRGVDFSRETVLAVATGDRPSSGYAATFLEIRRREVGALALWEEFRPGRDCITFSAVTRPWAAVRIPRVEGDVVFTGSVAVGACGGEVAVPLR